MKETFTNGNHLRTSTKALIAQADSIVTEYLQQGYVLTLRQLYYQFVSRTLLPNTDASYDRLGSAVSDGRMCGLIDWDAIEDRIRVPDVPVEFTGLGDLVNQAIQQYRLNRWHGQHYLPELWVEKDALAGVLQPLAREYHITLMVNRGYSSTSAMYVSSKRFLRAQSNGHRAVILYLGDHDPSGLDMLRDIKNRLREFGVWPLPLLVPVALTMTQVKRYNLPPNPTKLTDSRAKDYVEKFGYQSWEVDALPPQLLQQMIRSALDRNIDKFQMQQVANQEEVDKRSLLQAVEHLIGRRSQ